MIGNTNIYLTIFITNIYQNKKVIIKFFENTNYLQIIAL